MSRPQRTRADQDKVREHRHAQGLRPILIGGPDAHALSVRAQAHAQSPAVASADRTHEDQAFIDAVSDWGEA